MRLLLTLTFVVASFTALQAKPTAAEFTGSLPLLLTSDNVRDELELNSLQRAVLDSMRSEYKNEARKLVATQPQTAEARTIAQGKLDALNEKYNSRAISALSTNQAEELLTIQHALLKGFTLILPAVQARLQLNRNQRNQISAIQSKFAAYNGKVNHDFEAGKISSFERRARLAKYRAEQSAAMENVLTPAQLAQLTSLRKTR